MEVETQHHEVATAGQAEIDTGSTTSPDGRQAVLYKYIVKNVAKEWNKTVT